MDKLLAAMDGKLHTYEVVIRVDISHQVTRIESAVRSGSLYCAGENGEGYMIFETPETKGTFSGSLLQLKWMLSAYGLTTGIRQIREIMRSGTYLASEMKKEKKPFVKI